jgi:putative hydrolase of the HAD superfamily
VIKKGQRELRPPVRWVLFDAVGTLIFPDPPVAEVYQATARRFGSAISVGEIQTRFVAALSNTFCGGGPTSEANERQRWRSIVREVISDIPDRIDAAFEQLWQHFAEPKHWRLYDDVAATWQQLREGGFQLGIASNFDRRLKRIVAEHPLLAAGSEVFVSSDVGYSKPDARFFRTIEARLGVHPEEIALVGDDETCDVRPAIAAGWRAIHLDRKLAREGAIRSLAELR